MFLPRAYPTHLLRGAAGGREWRTYARACMNVYIYMYILYARRGPLSFARTHTQPQSGRQVSPPPLPPSFSFSSLKPRPRPWTLQGRTCSQTVCHNNMNILNFYNIIRITKYRVYSRKYKYKEFTNANSVALQDPCASQGPGLKGYSVV